MTNDESTVAVTLQIPKELFEKLKQVAVQDLRPMKEELIVLLHEALDGRKPQR